MGVDDDDDDDDDDEGCHQELIEHAGMCDFSISSVKSESQVTRDV